MIDSAPGKSLFVLLDLKRFGPLSRREVEHLVLGGRLNDNSLIRALRGPWMRIADFFGLPEMERIAEVRTKPQRMPRRKIIAKARRFLRRPPAKTQQADADDTSIVFLDGSAEVRQLRDRSNLRTGKLVQPKSAVPPRKAPKNTADSGILLFTGWYVIVDGMPSRKVSLEGMQIMMEQGKISPRSMARHENWRPNDWRTIASIPEIAENLR